MFENFKNELIKKAMSLGISNVEEIVDIYKRRLALGLEAGFTEEEVVDRFGNIDEILEKYKSGVRNVEKPVSTLKEIRLAISDTCDICVVKGDKPAILEIDDDMKERYRIVDDGERIIIESIEDSVKFRKTASYDDVVIALPAGAIVERCNIAVIHEDIDWEVPTTFAEFDLSAVSADITFKFFKAKRAEFSTVSGDIDIATCAALDLKISSVSGDVTADTATIKKLEVSTISGDVDMTGNVEKVDSSSISGEISINHQSQKTSLVNALSSLFRF